MFILHQILPQWRKSNKKSQGERMNTFQPQTEKEAEEALKHDYDFEDRRTMKELKRDLRTCLTRM